MPDHPGYVLEDSTSERIGRVVKAFERGKLGNLPGELDDGAVTASTPLVYVTAGSAVSGYPVGYFSGTLDWYEQETDTWFEAIEPVYILELNGKSLTSGDRYACRFHETVLNSSGNQVAVYSVNKGGVGNTLECPHVSGVVCTGGYLAVTYGTECDAAP